LTSEQIALRDKLPEGRKPFLRLLDCLLGFGVPDMTRRGVA